VDTEDEDTETVSIELLPPPLTDPTRYQVIPPVATPVVHLQDKKEVAVEITNAAGESAKTLRVGRWENAFKRLPGEGIDIEVVADFIDKDPDRFGVRVTDAASNKNANVIEIIVVSAKMDTAGAKARKLILTETGINTGVFVSKSLLMTSFAADDAYEVDNIATDKKDDRSFLMPYLNGSITVTHGAITATATAPVEKVVKLHVNAVRLKKKADGGLPFLDINGDEVTTEKDFDLWVERLVNYTNKVYAPLGIRFELVGGKVNYVDPPAGVDLSDGLKGWGVVQNKIVLTAEEKALLGDATLRTVAVDDIEVYFVSAIDTPRDAPGAVTYGQALAPSYSPLTLQR